MKIEEDELRDILRAALTDINEKKKETKDRFKDVMFNMYNITGGETNDILNGKTPVDLMQKSMLFKITNALYHFNKNVNSTFDYHKLDVDDYFYDNEKNEFGQKIDRKVQDEDIIIQSGKWMQVEEDQYIIKLYPDELMEVFINRNKINYNPETQRDLTIKETKTGKVKAITFFEKSYENIVDSMENNLYISDMLALNINPDYFEPPKIIRDSLVISKNSRIDCIDGYHRLKAAVTTKLRNPNWNKPLTFFLFICDVNKAVRYILQQDIKNHLTEKQVTKVDVTDSTNFILDKLNNSVDFILRNTIDDDMRFALNKIISKLFNPKKLYNNEDRREAVELYKFIESNINNLIEQDNLYDKEFTKEVWLIYLYCLKYCSDTKLNFIEVARKIDVDDIAERVKFVMKPTDGNYKILKEVFENV